MYYPYYQDPMTGVPAGHFSAPLSRGNISNPITPYGIPYHSPHQSPYPPVVPGPQRQPHRFRNALQKGLLLGGALYAASQLGKGGDDGDDNGGDGSRAPFIPKSPKTPPSDKFANQPQINDGGYPGDIGHKKPAENYLTTDPEEVGGLRSQVSKDFLSDFRKNIASEYTFDSVPPVESERVGVSPEQEARSRTWTSLDNDRFFDHPDLPPGEDDAHIQGDQSLNDAVDNFLVYGATRPVTFEQKKRGEPYRRGASEAIKRVQVDPEMHVDVDYHKTPGTRYTYNLGFKEGMDPGERMARAFLQSKVVDLAEDPYGPQLRAGQVLDEVKKGALEESYRTLYAE